MRSDAQGRFRLVGLPRGSHRVEAMVPGFQRPSADLELSARHPDAHAALSLQAGRIEEPLANPVLPLRYRVWPLAPASH